ncbi:MAG: hypothetical protein U5L04_00395 [Trueperaceae bacterium]|nr:hypothetical protein [Trueperaceae bacterium]
MFAQVSVPQSTDSSAELNGTLGLVDRDVIAGLGASFSQSVSRSRELTLGVSAQRSVRATVVGMRLTFRGFF